MTSPSASASASAPALAELRDALAGLALPLEVPGATQARKERDALVAQLDDYLLPRYARLDAPLLVVVGGSTGAGKSTLVNTLVGEVVTRTGAIRPTTRDPVLVHHPDDAAWFTQRHILPGMPRVRRAAPSTAPPEVRKGDAPAGLFLVPSRAVGPGLALLDAPDVDSVVDENRRLATELLAAADLWLFVTSAHRYADAVPWELLRDAAERDAQVAIVLDRAVAEDVPEIRADLLRMLAAEGLQGAPLFTVLESARGLDGRLPGDEVAQVRRWLQDLAGSAADRAEVARRTLDGAVTALARNAEGLADAADAQHDAFARLLATIDSAYEAAADAVVAGTGDGSLLRGEVLARWQDLVGTGELLRSLQGRVAAVRDRLSAAIRRRPQRAQEVEIAIEHGIAALLVDQAGAAAEHAQREVARDPAGRALLALSLIHISEPTRQ